MLDYLISILYSLLGNLYPYSLFPVSVSLFSMLYPLMLYSLFSIL